MTAKDQKPGTMAVYADENLFGGIMGNLCLKLATVISFDGALTINGLDRLVQDCIIRDPKSQDIHVGMVTFSPIPAGQGGRHPTLRQQRGKIIKNQDSGRWNETTRIVNDTYDIIVGEAQLPDEHGHLNKVQVRLSVVTDGKGGVIPALQKNPEGEGWLSGPALPCIFHFGVKREGRNWFVDESVIYAFPIGLADQDHLEPWNRRAQIKQQMGIQGTWLQFAHIPNNIGTMCLLDFMPEFIGNAGQYWIWPKWIDKKARRPPNVRECKLLLQGKLEGKKIEDYGHKIFGRYGGKKLVLAPGISLRLKNLPTDTDSDGKPIPTMISVLIVEGLNSIRVIAIRGKAEVTTVDQRTLDRGDTQIPDSLTLIGGSYATTDGINGIGDLLTQLRRNPPVQRLRKNPAWQDLVAGGPDGFRTWLRGTSVKLAQGANQQLIDAATIMEKALAPHSGTEGVSIGIRDLFGGRDELLAYLDRKGEWEGSHDIGEDPFTEPAPDSIYEFMDFRQHSTAIAGNLLMQEILTSQTADRHGIVEFNRNSWVLREVYIRLWKVICHTNGVIIPRRKKALAQPTGQQRATRA